MGNPSSAAPRGNPSGVEPFEPRRTSTNTGTDLESAEAGATEFEPPTWHASAGRCEGYLGQARGAARGEGAGPLLQHSCWTYWGHSGAPLFDERGRVAGLHCAWDEATGARHGQALRHVREALRRAGGLAAADSDDSVIDLTSTGGSPPRVLDLTSPS